MRLQFKTVTALMRAHFFAGLLVVIPLAVIGWMITAALGALWELHTFLPEQWRPENFADPVLALLVNVAFTAALALVLAFGVSMLGWSSKQFLGRKVLDFLAEDVIQRIPVVRSVYSALDQLLRTMAAGGSQQFSRVVYVEYPRKGVLALAFVTGAAKGPNLPPGYLNVYVPTTPNPTSGFHLLVPESEVRESHLSVEDAFKTLLSLGIAQGGAPGEPQ